MQAQSRADADYFIAASDGRFLGVLTSMITSVQVERITNALAPLMA